MTSDDPQTCADTIAKLRARVVELEAQRAAFLAACDEAMAADPGRGGRGLTARAARLYFEDGDGR